MQKVAACCDVRPLSVVCCLRESEPDLSLDEPEQILTLSLQRPLSLQKQQIRDEKDRHDRRRQAEEAQRQQVCPNPWLSARTLGYQPEPLADSKTLARSL